MNEYPYEIKQRLEALETNLLALLSNDSEQELTGVALHSADEVISAARRYLSGKDETGLIHVDMIESGEFHRVADVLILVSDLNARIGPYPIVFA
jgi:hypothetical protein